jgi:ABC-type sugar transport system ATPase subunit
MFFQGADKALDLAGFGVNVLRGVFQGADQLLRKLADEGMAVIMVSSELPEILSISDRILVMRRGRINGEFTAEATEEQIMEKAVLAGGKKKEA